jgi:hypothetical protein
MREKLNFNSARNSNLFLFSGARLLEIKRFMDSWAETNGFYTIDTTVLTPKEVAAEIVLWYQTL